MDQQSIDQQLQEGNRATNPMQKEDQLQKDKSPLLVKLKALVERQQSIIPQKQQAKAHKIPKILKPTPEHKILKPKGHSNEYEEYKSTQNGHRNGINSTDQADEEILSLLAYIYNDRESSEGDSSGINRESYYPQDHKECLNQVKILTKKLKKSYGKEPQNQLKFRNTTAAAATQMKIDENKNVESILIADNPTKSKNYLSSVGEFGFTFKGLPSRSNTKVMSAESHSHLFKKSTEPERNINGIPNDDSIIRILEIVYNQ